jgi:flagellar motor switch protein FliN/FliY
MPEEIETAEAVEANRTEAESSKGPEVRSAEFAQISPAAKSTDRSPLDLILDVGLEATVELGRSSLIIREILALGPGSVVELDKLAGEPADLLINGRPLARGEVVVIDDHFGLRVTEIMSPSERIDSLR